jgi:genome maintenance exonuclease 1
MLIERYQYQHLEKVSSQGKRYYVAPGGQPLPSVTTILDKTKPEESRAALEKWKQRVGHQRAQQITTEAANRGTRMHTFLEHYVRTGELSERPSNPFAWPSHAMAETVIKQGLKNVTEFWGVEIPLYFPEIYAGTTDGCGLHQGVPAILDYKQTNRPKKEEWIEDYRLQLAAYAEAHNEVYGSNISKGVILMCVKPESDSAGHLLTQPQYQEFIIEGAEFDRARSAWWHRVEQYYQKHG